MKRLAILCAVFVFTALFTVSAIAQTEEKKDDKNELLATWDLTISAPGQELPGTFTFEKDGDNYKGLVKTDLGEVPLKNIKVTGDSFTADISANIQGQTMEGTMTGKITDGKLAGDINIVGLGAIPYSGKKAENK